MPLLEPVHKIRSLKVRLAEWMTKRRYGQGMTPLRVLYARRPFLMDLVVKIFSKDKKLELSADFAQLVRHHVSKLNGCSFCQDISKAHYQDMEGREDELISALPHYQESPLFSEAEKRALEWVEACLNPKEPSAEAFQALREHWSEEAAIDLCYLAASESYINIMNRSFGIGSDGFCELKQDGG